MPDRRHSRHDDHHPRRARIAYCECGAQFAGDSDDELFEAAQAHLAHHHPQLLEELELGVLTQMAEELPGAANA